MYEVVLTRIFSVTMWYHFAFGVISLALFGMTAGALIVHLLPRRFGTDVALERLWQFALLFGVSIAISLAVQLRSPVDPRVTLGGIFSLVAVSVVVSIPFIFSGVVVCMALTRFPRRVNRLYAADLIGAALGCVFFVMIIDRIDGPSVVIVCGAIAALGSVCFAYNARRAAALIECVVCFALISALALTNSALHGGGSEPLHIRYVKGVSEPLPPYEKWNAFSRVTVGARPNQLDMPSVGMLIDSTAGTPLMRYNGNGDFSKLASLKDDVTNLAHYIKHKADELVIGVGGGRDVLSALAFGQRSVKGVEINSNVLHVTNGVYGNFTGHLDRDPRVTFVNDEARSYLARNNAKYDLIQISLIDTWAATSSGAFALSENGLYTTNAWKIFFDRLKPGGILSVSRWYNRATSGPPVEMYRTTALAVQALKEHGVSDPRDHIAVYEGQPMFFGTTVATLLVSPQPLTSTEYATLDATAKHLGFTRILTPTGAIDHVFSDLASPGGPAKGVHDVDVDISPPTDNRPFFFQMVDVHSLGTMFTAQHRDDSVYQPVLVLTVLSLTVLILTLAFILVPLLLTTRRGTHRGMAGFYLFFAAIGFGFLVIEVSLLQRLSVFLGNPAYGLTVVLFSMLLFSGIGSMLTERFLRVEQRRTFVAPLAVLLVVIVAFGLLAPSVLLHAQALTTQFRIAIAVLLLAPLSLCMGMPFAMGMRMAAARSAAPTAFMWGINGVTSVCGSVFGLVLALFFGIATAFWAGAVAYAVAWAAMVSITRVRREPSAVVERADLTLEPTPVA